MTVINDITARLRRPSPAATLAIICAAVFVVLRLTAIVMRFSGATMSIEALLHQLMLPASLQQAATKPWTALTYMFIHYDALHLIMNLLWLYLFASIAQAITDKKRIYTLFLAGGLAGAAAFLFAGAISTSVYHNELTGASASILAVMGYAMATAPKMRLRLVFFGETTLKTVGFIAILLVIIGSGTANYGTHAAHAGGFIAGVIIAMVSQRQGHATQHRMTRPIITTRRHDNCTTATESTPSATPTATTASDSEKLDELLDKIRRSGFGSLSAQERDTLFRISSNLQKRH